MTHVITQAAPAIVFDFGGVLMDWNPHYLFDKLMDNDPVAVDQFLSEVGFFEWNEEFDRGRPYVEGVAMLSDRFPQYADLIHAYDERYLETVRGCNQPVVDILTSLKEGNYPLFGLSNWSFEKFTQVRKKYPFFDLFDDMVISGLVKCIKPGPEIFGILLQRTSRAAGDCIFIDDHKPNIDAARDLGFQTILFKSAVQLKSDLAEHGIFLA